MLETDWRRNWVIYPVPETEAMQTLLKGSRLVLYKIEAPLDVRFARSGHTDFTKFVQETSRYERAMVTGQSIPVERVFVNDSNTLEEFHSTALDTYDFLDFTVVRPNWDKYFM